MTSRAGVGCRSRIQEAGAPPNRLQTKGLRKSTYRMSIVLAVSGHRGYSTLMNKTNRTAKEIMIDNLKSTIVDLIDSYNETESRNIYRYLQAVRKELAELQG